MTYTFEPFLEAIDTNWFDDDALLLRLLNRYAYPAVWATRRSELHAWGEAAAGRLRLLAEDAALPGNEP
jgi:hypothetical protein